jgi:hypothetical protein
MKIRIRMVSSFRAGDGGPYPPFLHRRRTLGSTHRAPVASPGAMTILVGPFQVAALVLVAAGALKVVSPAATVVALEGAGVRAQAAAVRAAALAETVLGAAAIATGNRALVAGVALSYLAFAAFVGRAMVRPGAIGDCGCLGVVESPPSWSHVVIDLAAAAVCGAAAVVGVPSLGGLLDDHPVVAVPYLALAVGAILLLTVGRRRPASPPTIRS